MRQQDGLDDVPYGLLAALSPYPRAGSALIPGGGFADLFSIGVHRRSSAANRFCVFFKLPRTLVSSHPAQPDRRSTPFATQKAAAAAYWCRISPVGAPR